MFANFHDLAIWSIATLPQNLALIAIFGEKPLRTPGDGRRQQLTDAHATTLSWLTRAITAKKAPARKPTMLKVGSAKYIHYVKYIC